MIGYKGFDKDFKCRGFQYEVGKTYKLEGVLKLCENGFHFCTKPLNVLYYYPSVYVQDSPMSVYEFRRYIPTYNRYALIAALGDIVFSADKSKCATNKIRIIREASIEELQALYEKREKRIESQSIFYDDVLAWEGKA